MISANEHTVFIVAQCLTSAFVACLYSSVVLLFNYYEKNVSY